MKEKEPINLKQEGLTRKPVRPYPRRGMENTGEQQPGVGGPQRRITPEDTGSILENAARRGEARRAMGPSFDALRQQAGEEQGQEGRVYTSGDLMQNMRTEGYGRAFSPEIVSGLWRERKRIQGQDPNDSDSYAPHEKEQIARGLPPGILTEEGAREEQNYEDIMRQRGMRELGATSRELLEMLKRDIGRAHNKEELDAYLEKLQGFFGPLTQIWAQDQVTDLLGTFERIKESVGTNQEDAKISAQDLIDDIKDNYAFAHEVTEADEYWKMAKCLEDVVDTIMRRERDIWKTGNIRQLMDRKGNIVKENFLQWIRERRSYFHNLNPTSEVDFLSSIQTPNPQRPISLSEMLYYPRYFLKRGERRIVGVDGAEKTQEVYHEDSEYEELKDAILKETWLFQTSRNWHVNYTKSEIIGNDEQLPKFLLQMYGNNEATRYMDFIMSLPSTTIPFEGEGSFFDKEKNHRAGDMIRKAVLAYYNLADIDKLEEVLGKDSIFFHKTWWKVDTAGVNKDGQITNEPKEGQGIVQDTNPNEKDSPENPKVYLRWNPNWYDENGRLKNEAWARGQFMTYINIFREQTKDPAIVDELRERIRESLSEKLEIDLKQTPLYTRLKDDARRRLKVKGGIALDQLDQEVIKVADFEIKRLAYKEAQMSEEMAYTMTRWTGAGARNDTEDRAYDAFTKVLDTQKYREAQLRKGGSAGNRYNIPIFKRLAADFFTGIMTLNGDTTLEMLYKLDMDMGPNKDKSKEEKDRIYAEEIKKLKYAAESMRSYSINHIARSFELFQSLSGSKELKLQEIIKLDPIRGVVIDQEKFEQTVQEGFMKPMRYAYSTWGGVDYSKNTRVFKKAVEHTDKEGRRWKEYVYEDTAMADALFGKEALADVEKYHKDGDIKKEMDYRRVQTQNRNTLWKELAKERIYAEIWSHRALGSGKEKFKLSALEPFFMALESIPSAVVVDENDIKNTEPTKYLFDAKDIKWIRKKSETEFSRLFLEEVRNATGIGGAVGLLKALRIWLAGTLKNAFELR